MSVPISTAERLRAWTVAVLSPIFQRASHVAVVGISNRNGIKGDLRRPLTFQEQAELLELENSQLRNEVMRLTELLAVEHDLTDRIKDNDIADGLDVDAALERRRRERLRILRLQLQALPARVVFRSPTAWNNSFWLNVGEADNVAIGRKVVAKNSPVVVGNSLVGIVDLVNSHQCRVKLITDPGFSPAVRAVRGDPQRQELLEHLDTVASGLAHDETLFRTPEERSRALDLVLDVRDRMQAKRETWQAAKGELHGSSLPVWRRKGSIVRGVGFNYDFADEEGPARDLVTGKVLGSCQDEADLSLLKVDDLLITTGLDGILIPGLRVATVTKVLPLGEGDYFYEVEAKPTVGDMDAISLVSVLPPLEPE